jgi:hypothetical protein
MLNLDGVVESITGEIRYLRGDLDRLAVEYTARVLADETVDTRTLPIRNGRALGRAPSLEREGFQIADWPSRVVRERLEELTAPRVPLKPTPPVQFDYWSDTIPLIQKLSGAREVLPVHASGVRYSTRANKTGFITQANWAHLDYDADEAAVQLEETLELNGRAVKPFGRYVLYQGWRVLTDPPQDFPLALCDGRTVETSDIVPVEYHLNSAGRDVTYRSNGSRYSERHQWWYFPDMTVDEMIVFKGFDSDTPHTPKTLHVAFEDKTAADPPPRASIETRYFAFYD